MNVPFFFTLICMNKIYYLILVLFVSSCQKDKQNNSYSLVAVDDYLSFSIDENTRLPKFCLWTFSEGENEFLTFPNVGKEILFYDLKTGNLVNKTVFDTEGNNGVGNIYGYSVIDFNHIYIASPMTPTIFVTDTTGIIHSKVRYNVADDGSSLVPALAHSITYSPIYVFGDSIYLAQDMNLQLSHGNSPYGVMIDRKTNKKVVTPLKHRLILDEKDLPRATGGAGKVSVCYDGSDFVYSSELSDSVCKLSRDFAVTMSYCAKSRYIDAPKVEVLSHDADVEMILKRKCELPTYGNLIYDKYRNVYYRFAYPATELDEERSYMEIYHNGRKRFSIIILDKEMNVLGETLFPDYTYNANLFFITKDGLYLSVTHFKRPDFDENVLRFQKIELQKVKI